MSVFKVLDKLCLPDFYCVSVEGDTQLLRKGLKLIDEKGNIFAVETVAMTEYRNIESYKRYADIVLSGNIKNLGTTLKTI